MTISVEELYRRAQMLREYEIQLTAGKDHADVPVFRVAVVADLDSAEKTQMYDIVIFNAACRGKCSILNAAERVSSRKAGALVISRSEYASCELTQARRLCDSLSLPLIEVAAAYCLPSLVSFFYEEIIEYFESVQSVSKLLQGVIMMPDHYRNYRNILGRYGFLEHSDYCVAVCDFVSRDKQVSEPCNLIPISHFFEIGIRMNGYASAVLSMDCRLAVVFADFGEENVIASLKRGIASIPPDMSDGLGIYIGVSEVVRGISNLSDLYAFAAKAAVLQMRRGNDRIPLSSSENPLNRFMISLNKREAINSLVRDTMQELAEYDRQNDTYYIELLRTYFRNNCSAQKTANELYVHRNSVNYALRKIESILGCNLSDINTKAWLFLALGFSELSGDDYYFSGRAGNISDRRWFP